MKATLEFDLTEIDQEFAHMRCIRSLDMYLTLLKIDQLIKESDIENEAEINPELYRLKSLIMDVYMSRDIDLNMLGN